LLDEDGAAEDAIGGQYRTHAFVGLADAYSVMGVEERILRVAHGCSDYRSGWSATSEARAGMDRTKGEVAAPAAAGERRGAEILGDPPAPRASAESPGRVLVYSSARILQPRVQSLRSGDTNRHRAGELARDEDSRPLIRGATLLREAECGIGADAEAREVRRMLSFDSAAQVHGPTLVRHTRGCTSSSDGESQNGRDQ